MATTNFVWDELSDNVLTEVDGVGTTQVTYTNEPKTFGSLISQKRGLSSSFYSFDGGKSTRQLTDANQSVTDTLDFTGYGEQISQLGSTANPFCYKGAVGYYTDSETEEIYVRRRSYSSSLGRWLSFDPTGFVDGQNLYFPYFVPSHVDSSGERCEPSDPPIPITVDPDPHGEINKDWRPHPARGYRVDLSFRNIKGCNCCDGIECCDMDIELHVRAYRYYRHDEDGLPIGHDGEPSGVSNDPRDFASMVIIDVCQTNIVCCGVKVPDDWHYSIRSGIFYKDGRGTYIRQGEGDIEMTAMDFDIAINEYFLKNGCCTVAEDLLDHINDNVVPGEIDG